MLFLLKYKLTIHIIIFIQEFCGESNISKEIKKILFYGLNNIFSVKWNLLKTSQVKVKNNFFTYIYDTRILMIETPFFTKPIKSIGKLQKFKMNIDIGYNKFDNSEQDMFTIFNALDNKENISFLNLMFRLEHELYIKMFKDETIKQYLVSYKYYPIILSKDIEQINDLKTDFNVIGCRYLINLEFNDQTQYYVFSTDKTNKIKKIKQNMFDFRHYDKLRFIFKPFILISHELKIIKIKLIVKSTLGK